MTFVAIKCLIYQVCTCKLHEFGKCVKIRNFNTHEIL